MSNYEASSGEIPLWIKIAEDSKLRAKEGRIDELHELVEESPALGTVGDLDQAKFGLMTDVLSHYGVSPDAIDHKNEDPLEQAPSFIFPYGDARVEMSPVNGILAVSAINKDTSPEEQKGIRKELVNIYFSWQNGLNVPIYQDKHPVVEEARRELVTVHHRERAAKVQTKADYRLITLYSPRPTLTIPVALSLIKAPIIEAVGVIGSVATPTLGKVVVDKPGEFYSFFDNKQTWKITPKGFTK